MKKIKELALSAVNFAKGNKLLVGIVAGLIIAVIIIIVKG